MISSFMFYFKKSLVNQRKSVIYCFRSVSFLEIVWILQDDTTHRKISAFIHYTLCLWIRNKVQPLKTKNKIPECKFYDEETPEYMYNKNSTGNIIGLCGKYNILYVW